MGIRIFIIAIFYNVSIYAAVFYINLKRRLLEGEYVVGESVQKNVDDGIASLTQRMLATALTSSTVPFKATYKEAIPSTIQESDRFLG